MSSKCAGSVALVLELENASMWNGPVAPVLSFSSPFGKSSCAPDDVYDAAHESARRFVGGPALALAAAKEAIDRGLSVDLDSGLAIERRLFASLFATDDQTAGMTSFVENGPGHARFVGH